MAKSLTFKTRLTMRADGRNDPHHGFGKGIEMLLLGVDKFGSLNRAAKEMGMAYSKAWNVLRLNESEFGIKFSMGQIVTMKNVGEMADIILQKV